LGPDSSPRPTQFFSGRRLLLGVFQTTQPILKKKPPAFSTPQNLRRLLEKKCVLKAPKPPPFSKKPGGHKLGPKKGEKFSGNTQEQGFNPKSTRGLKTFRGTNLKNKFPFPTNPPIKPTRWPIRVVANNKWKRGKGTRRTKAQKRES